MSVRLVVMLLTVSVIIGCSEDAGGGSSDFDRGPILETLADDIIVPAYVDFELETASLIDAVETFNAEVNEANLTALKVSWEAARMSWKKAETFNFGPIDTRFLYSKIDIFPVSTSGIDEAVNEYDGSDDFLVGVGSTSKGFGAMEYLLFQAESEVILEDFTDEKRRGYLLALAVDMNAIAETVLDDWQSTYAGTFKLNTGNDVGASITLFTNALIQQIEVIKNFKVATPLGARTGGEAMTELVESPGATISSEMIVANMDAIEEAFKGGTGEGLDDYLDALDAGDGEGNLADEIDEKIAACRAIAVEMGSLTLAIENEDESVENLLVALQELTTLTKSDMMSQLGLVITFSSNDGD